jgi:hypothetical protein
MSKCIYRTDLKLRPVSEPLFGIDAMDMFFRPGMPTIQQCVHMLVAQDEICLGSSDTRAIMRGPRVVGYVRIVDEQEWNSLCFAHRDRKVR